jgi:hypothetical protein
MFNTKTLVIIAAAFLLGGAFGGGIVSAIKSKVSAVAG